MLFCTLPFLGFFLVVFTLYWSLPWQRARVWLLLAASLTFYASWNQWLALVVLASSCADYLLARGLDATPSPRLRKLLLLTSIVANLGLLCYFKYANFFLRSLEDALHAAGLESSLPVLSVILPVGISFYTFEAISYMVDVYQGRLRAERNLGNFLLFILFFPHLVAGPIVRARDFLPQVRRVKRFRWPRAHLGARLFLLGLFKKLVLADRMALFVDPAFADPAAYSTATLWLATIAYTIQLFCDFSGYSDMALGVAHLLGYKLTLNFRLPYLAVNVSEFWRRWHISLSSWLRDYLFIPLGGSRGGNWLTCRNLLITMTLGGLWHGASWTFALWGVVQGLYLVIHRGFRAFCQRRIILPGLLATLPGKALCIGLTVLAWAVSLVLFRSPSLAVAGDVFRGLAGLGAGTGRLDGLFVYLAVLLMAAGHAGAALRLAEKPYQRLPAPLRGLGYAAVLLAVLLLTPVSTRFFIYFQF